MLCCHLYVHTLVPFYAHNLLPATVAITSRNVRGVPHQSLWMTHIKTCCYTVNNRYQTHTTATACCSFEYSSNKYSFETFTKVQLCFYIHKRKGHKVLKKRRKGSRQLRKKEEYPFLWILYAPPSSPLFFILLLLFAFFGIFKDLGRWGLPLGFSSLKKCHTEGRSEWRNIKASTGRRTEAPSVRGVTELVCQFY